MGPIYLNRYEWQEILSEFSSLVKTKPDVKKIEYKLWRKMAGFNNVAIRFSDVATSISIYTANEVIGLFKTDDHSFGNFLANKYKSEEEEDTMGESIINNAVFYDTESRQPIMMVDNATLTYEGASASTTNLNVNSSGADGTYWTDSAVINDTYYNSYFTQSINYNNNTNKENDIMDAKKILNVEFGPCGDSVHMSMYGPAIKNQAGEWVSCDEATGDIVNVEVLNFAEGGKFFYKMPVPISKIDVGDILIHNRQPVFVSGFAEDTLNPIVINIYDGTRVEILPTKSCFGFNYCTKIISLLDGFNGKMFADADHPFGNLLPLMLLSGNGKMDDMLPFVMMMQNESENMNVFENPMMMYLLMSKDGKMSDMLPFMLMMNQNK